MSSFAKSLFAATVVAAAAGASIVMAAESTKDVVIDRVAAPVVAVAAPAATTDAMAVSVLLESPDGTLTPRSTDTMFRTGDRFRVKLLASRDARVALYNTNPKGVLSPEPVWSGDVKVGLDTITPRLRLDGNSGIDYLHIVMEPTAPPQGVFAWLGSWLRKDEGAKDIRLDVQNTPAATYVLNPNGQGLVTTMRIVHR